MGWGGPEKQLWSVIYFWILDFHLNNHQQPIGIISVIWYHGQNFKSPLLLSFEWVDPMDIMRYHSHYYVTLYGERKITLGGTDQISETIKLAFSLADCRKENQRNVLQLAWRKQTFTCERPMWAMWVASRS